MLSGPEFLRQKAASRRLVMANLESRHVTKVLRPSALRMGSDELAQNLIGNERVLTQSPEPLRLEHVDVEMLAMQFGESGSESDIASESEEYSTMREEGPIRWENGTVKVELLKRDEESQSSTESETASQSGEEESEGRTSSTTNPSDSSIPHTSLSYKSKAPPTIHEAMRALEDLNGILRPRRSNGKGDRDPNIPLVLRTRLEQMKTLLVIYLDAKGVYGGQWMAASMHAATIAQAGPSKARSLRYWLRAFIADRSSLPTSKCKGSKSRIEDEDVAEEITLPLQSKGKYVRAQDIVDYVDIPEVKRCLGLEKGISLATAQRWMKRIEFVDGDANDK
ncbi:hypothetical protein DXG03_002842 [Asterophora parasitica]|uniref:Uncharacterized protein n=1 Tax=Asterophora parasitica TaxID=117018 RepID=A0A9P7G2X0_9AGAR|nr:hypothetical protein DXG03_002842 [Asterophora parasitica]